MAEILRMTLLGGLSIALGDEPLTRFISSKSPALFSYLAYTGQPHTRAALTGLLWGDSPEAQAKASLRQVLSDLRRVLGAYLIIEGNTVAFNPAAPHWLDVAEFNRHLRAVPADAGATLTESQAAALQAAVDLYKGDFLAGFFVPNAAAFEEWVTGEQEWLRQAALQAMHRLILHYTQTGAYLMGINVATRLLALEPWQEEAHRQLMLLLALNGQRGAALAQYETCRRILAKDLGVEPTRETISLFEQIRGGLIGPGRGAAVAPLIPPPPTNLPAQTTPFIGREAELAEIVGRLARGDGRCITITGVGGVGKTRLALAAADEVKRSFPHGVWYVPLTGVFGDEEDAGFRLPAEPNGAVGQQLVDEIATAMKLSFSYHADPARQLIDHLHDKKILLVIDGLRALHPQIRDFLARLLTETAGVTLLITAPTAVGLPGEHVRALAGLPTPVGDDPAIIAGSPSVRLFIERANRAAGGFRPGPKDWPAIVAICRLLEGNPLGIELAAAWVEHWQPAEILATLRGANGKRPAPSATAGRPTDERDAPPAVEAAFVGRWDLLAPAERDALAQLTVFHGDFSEQAAEAITGASRETLAALAERLLLQTPAPGRYAMHRLIRRFMLALMSPRDELAPRGPQPQDRHSTYYLRLLAQREASLERREMTRALAELQAEWRHIQQAWEWAAARGDVERLQQSANALSRYLSLRGLYGAGERLFRRAATALEARPAAEGPADEATGLITALTRGQMLLFQARFINLQGDRERLFAVAEAAQALFQQALEKAQAEDIRELAIACRSNLGNLAVLQSDYMAARDHLEAALQLCAQDDQPQIAANLLSDLGVVMMLYGDYAAARRYLERSLQGYRQTGNRLGEVLASFHLGRVTDAVGLYDEAQACFDRALQGARALEDPRLEAQVLAGLALLHCHKEDYNRAWETSHDALRLAEAISDRLAEAEALVISGDALLELGMTAEAKTAYQQALEIYEALDQPIWALEPRAGLALAALAEKQPGAAATHLDEILRYLFPPKGEHKTLGLERLQGIRDPFRLCVACSRVLRAMRSHRAPTCEEAAYQFLKERAERISDPLMRRAFMRQVPANRQIVEAHQANRTSPWR